MHPPGSQIASFRKRNAPREDRPLTDEPERKFYTLLKRGPGARQGKDRATPVTWRKPPEPVEHPSGLAGVWDRLRGFFFCPMFGLERALLLIAVPLGLALAVLLAVTAVGR